MVRRPATDQLFRSGAGLPLALGSSALLHLGLLFGIPAHSPALVHSGQPLSVRLVAAAADLSAQPAAQAAPATPQRPAHRSPPHIHIPAAGNLTHLADATPAAPATPAVAAHMPAATSAAQPGEISTTTYYDGSQLDVPPHLLGEVQQIYPVRARTADIEGSVTLSLLINEHGEVDQVSVLHAQPPGYFETAALDMLRKQRFAPAILHNQPVKSRWRTTVRYRLQS